MQRWAWTHAFAQAFGDRHMLRVAVVEEGAEIAAIAPLAVRRNGVTRLGLVGVDELSEPGDLVYRDASALDRLADSVVRLRRPLHLARIEAGSATVEALRRASGRRAIVYRRRVAPYPWIPLDEGWREPEQKFSSDRRSDLRRARRRAEQLGEVTVDVISPRREHLPPLLDELYRVEAAGWKGREGTALAADEQRRRFFTSLAESASEAGFLRLAFLRIAGRAAAVQLAAECGHRFWLLKVGYDEEFKRTSPGSLLMLETIQYAAEAGLESYELLGTSEPWTRVWTEHERPCVALRTYPIRPVGLAAAARDAAQLARRRRGGSL
jgi:CelD/BcsL family acetyltransferase involved in cellulose biosynthesis